MYKIAKENLTALFQKIAAEQELYLPVRNEGQVNFAAWSEDAQVDIDTLKTVKSPKDAFFPQSETLYTCVRDGKKISIEPEALKEQDFVVFGMRACDVRGVEVLDKVFLVDPLDTFYAARRDHGTIVALACHEPEETCFCKVFGIDAADPAADVATWMIGEDLYWKPLTEKGEALTKAVADLLTEDAARMRLSKKRKRRSTISSSSFRIHISLLRDGTEMSSWKNLRIRSGMICTNRVLRAEPVHLSARPASAMTSKTTMQERTACRDTAAGIPVCTPISR